MEMEETIKMIELMLLDCMSVEQITEARPQIVELIEMGVEYQAIYEYIGWGTPYNSLALSASK